MRLPGVGDDETGLLARIAYWMTRRRYGKVLDPVRIYAYRPRLLRAVGGLFRTIERSDRVPPRLRAMAVHHTARLIGCPF